MNVTALIDGGKGLRDASGTISEYASAISDYLYCNSWNRVPNSKGAALVLYIGNNGKECWVYFGFHERPL